MGDDELSELRKRRMAQLQQQAGDQQADMQEALAARRQEAHDPVRIEIAQQQEHLEEQHAGGPHRGRAAEPGQDHLADDGLHLEQQEGAEENGQAIVKDQAQVGMHGCIPTVRQTKPAYYPKRPWVVRREYAVEAAAIPATARTLAGRDSGDVAGCDRSFRDQMFADFPHQVVSTVGEAGRNVVCLGRV